MYFTSNLKHFTKTKIKQSKLAELLGIDKQQITRYLNGNEPKYERLIKICEILKISIDDMLKKDFTKEVIK